MNAPNYPLLFLFFLVLLVTVPLLGIYLDKVYSGACSRGPWGWAEAQLYRVCGVHPQQGMTWKRYALAVVVLNGIGFVFLFLLLIFQHHLPLNPQKIPGLPLDLAFNTAVSFVTNTNWQAYSGEVSLSYFSQMVGLTVQNFLSPAIGICALLVLMRGLTQTQQENLGNFWVDLTRSIFYVFLPLSLVLAVLLMSQGVVQSFAPYLKIATLEGSTQILPFGPAASQIAIKQLGSNGGGFFGVNSAHPFENPSTLSNFLQTLSIILIPAALTLTFGKKVGNLKQGISILVAMLLIYFLLLGLGLYFEFQSNPALGGLPFLEGKETRFGITESVLWSVSTTATSNGSVNSMHTSFSPLGGMVMLLNIVLGEVVFGGVGSGLYGILMFVFLTVFIAGLMVGRSPEYLGKKIESYEIKLAILAILLPSFLILAGTALSVLSPAGLAAQSQGGPHGLSEIFYGFASASANNGSALTGLNANSVFYNLLLGIAMLLGRFGVLLPALAIAGSLTKKKSVPPSAGTFPTDTLLFSVLLLGILLLVGALTFLPVLALGPIAEHLLMNSGVLF